MIYTFDKFEDFQEKAQALGIASDLAKLQKLDILFCEQYPAYVIFNLVSFETGLNKIIVLTKEDSLVYPALIFESNKLLKMRVRGPYSESTLAAYLVLKKVFDSYHEYFESIHGDILKMSETLQLERLEETSRRLRRLARIIDDFEALLIRLGESEIPFVDTKKLGYDFDVLMARSRQLAHRCEIVRSEINVLYTRKEMKETSDLNKRLERLTEVMKKLTAITVILMLPTLIASHYGMNFKSMPEISEPLAYPLVIAVSLTLIVLATLYFRSQKWL